MIIGACGFGATGSSAVTDYLKEFGNILVKDDLEFKYVSEVDGLLYLERAVMNPYNRTADSIYAIKRFEELVQRQKKYYQIHGLPSETFEKSAINFIDTITITKWYWNLGGKNSINNRYNFVHVLRRLVEKKIVAR